MMESLISMVIESFETGLALRELISPRKRIAEFRYLISEELM
jgi:hypothetical protein